jgi:sugar phosphate isomerase/epimerase
MTVRAAALVSLLLVGFGGTASAAEPPWINLFDGKSLRGWVQRGGGARYETRDGAIVGSSVPNTKNSFLCTERSFGDFVLELEFKADAQLNGGIQIRGQSSPEYQEGRVHGYQVEIDPDVKRGRMWTAGLYDEGRRGWLFEVHDEAAKKAFKPDDWNHLRVDARGDSIKTWLNGVPVTDLVDSMDQDGFIALQVHQVGKREEPLRHAWRNIRIQDWGRRTWMPALDGKTLKGMHPAGGGQWTVDGGVVVGTLPAGARSPGLLFVDRPVDDFTARLEYRFTGGNGGLYFRAEPADGPAGARGLQADFDATTAAGLYETGGRGWVARATVPAKPPSAPPPGAWHTLEVSAHGGRIVIHSDGRQTVALDGDRGAPRGQLALELATGAPARLEVRRLDLLSPPIPPPVPGFPVGWCIRIQGSAPEDARALGYEYVELALQDVLDLPEEEFARTVKRLEALGIPSTTGYNLIPDDLKLVGPDVDRARQDQRIKVGFARAAKLGLKAIVFNSGPARRAPEDFPRARAMEQLVDFTRRAASEGARHGIAFLVEPLRSTDTNMITTVAEAVALVRAVHRPNVQLLVDYSFLTIQKEDARALLAAKGHLHHLHIANPEGRGYPMSAEEAPYGELFAVLGQMGFRGGLSVHARTDLAAADAPRAISLLRTLAGEQLARNDQPPRRAPPAGSDQHSLPAAGNVTR